MFPAHIDPTQPVILITTVKDLQEFFVWSSGGTIKEVTTPVQNDLMSTQQVKKHLCDNGHKASSPVGMSMVLKRFNVELKKKMGRNNFYATSDILSIPSIK